MTNVNGRGHLPGKVCGKDQIGERHTPPENSGNILDKGGYKHKLWKSQERDWLV